MTKDKIPLTRTCPDRTRTRLDHVPVPLLQYPRSRDINPLSLSCLPQLPHILLRQFAILILHPRHLLILALEVKLHNHEARKTKNLQSNAYTQSGSIVRLRAREIRERCPNRCRITDGVDESERRSTLGGRSWDGI